MGARLWICFCIILLVVSLLIGTSGDVALCMQGSDYTKLRSLLAKAVKGTDCLFEEDKKLQNITIIGKLKLEEGFYKFLALNLSTQFVGIGGPGHNTIDKDIFKGILYALKLTFMHNIYINIDATKNIMTLAAFTHSDTVETTLALETTALVSALDLMLASKAQYLTGTVLSFDLTNAIGYFEGGHMQLINMGSNTEVKVWYEDKNIQSRLAYLNELNQLVMKIRADYLTATKTIKMPGFWLYAFEGFVGDPKLIEFDAATTKQLIANTMKIMVKK